MNLRPIAWAAFALLAGSAAAADDSELSAQEILATAKFTGACGVMRSMVEMQRTTQLAGGDEFITRFWKMEAARLGMTIEEIGTRCNEATANYQALWDASAQ